MKRWTKFSRVQLLSHYFTITRRLQWISSKNLKTREAIVPPHYMIIMQAANSSAFETLFCDTSCFMLAMAFIIFRNVYCFYSYSDVNPVEENPVDIQPRRAVTHNISMFIQN